MRKQKELEGSRSNYIRNQQELEEIRNTVDELTGIWGN